MRGYYLAQASEKGAQYLHSIFRACWGNDLDIRAMGLDPQEFAEVIEREETKQQLKEDTQRALDRGVFGTPTFFFDGQMYWGSPEIVWYLENEMLT